MFVKRRLSFIASSFKSTIHEVYRAVKSVKLYRELYDPAVVGR